VPPPRKPKKPLPKRYCTPPEAFGDPNAPARKWTAPGPDASRREHLDFAAVLMHNFWVMNVRLYKRRRGTGQAQLFRQDGRDRAEEDWGKRLNGGMALTPTDMAVLAELIPGAIPSFWKTQQYIAVTMGTRKRPVDWPWPDSI